MLVIGDRSRSGRVATWTRLGRGGELPHALHQPPHPSLFIAGVKPTALKYLSDALSQF